MIVRDILLVAETAEMVSPTIGRKVFTYEGSDCFFTWKLTEIC